MYGMCSMRTAQLLLLCLIVSRFMRKKDVQYTLGFTRSFVVSLLLRSWRYCRNDTAQGSSRKHCPKKVSKGRIHPPSQRNKTSKDVNHRHHRRRQHPGAIINLAFQYQQSRRLLSSSSVICHCHRGGAFRCCPKERTGEAPSLSCLHPTRTAHSTRSSSKQTSNAIMPP